MSCLLRYSEVSSTKCVGITIETRPDYCLKRHLSDMLRYGCTRLEVGVQSVYEDVARDTNRYHRGPRGPHTHRYHRGPRGPPHPQVPPPTTRGGWRHFTI